VQTSGHLAGPDVCLCMTCGDDDDSSCTHTQNDGQNDQSLNLLQCSLRSPWQRQLSKKKWLTLSWVKPHMTHIPHHSGN